MIACGERARRCYSTLLVVALAGTLTACGASSGDSPAPARQAATSAPAAPATASTTRPAPTTTSTTMPPYSFDGSVPPPEIVDTGDDYEAIAESLLAYIAWLKRHNPDPDLLSKVYVEGTDLMADGRKDLELLQSRSLRFVDVDQQIELEVASVDHDLVTVLVHERISAERLIDPRGVVVDERPSGPLNEYLLILRRSASRRWRISDVSKSPKNSQVQL